MNVNFELSNHPCDVGRLTKFSITGIPNTEELVVDFCGSTPDEVQITALVLKWLHNQPPMDLSSEDYDAFEVRDQRIHAADFVLELVKRGLKNAV